MRAIIRSTQTSYLSLKHTSRVEIAALVAVQAAPRAAPPLSQLGRSLCRLSGDSSPSFDPLAQS
eukprot:CAMPEP_0184554906 /NCGR_PEP_ID=MMETSP0199_2-20130426/36273_1 /TAXON_ID=1112570 /ORGANISM="Thraustochytrium sp., Strain LLF1b" /LENGTH=63 /DNA_ID=CAMNT_0026951097 /DNA_START=607 /DNA_END=795 /DNA_ORIENTATION=-